MSKEKANSDRLKQAQKIIRAPADFKICEGCDSIVVASANHCPNCHAYRFETDPERVKQQAEYLATRAQSSVIASDLE